MSEEIGINISGITYSRQDYPEEYRVIYSVLYTIVDLKEEVRGTDNLVFSFGYETYEDCKANLERLVNGEIEISHRNRLLLMWLQANNNYQYSELSFTRTDVFVCPQGSDLNRDSQPQEALGQAILEILKESNND